MDVTKLDKSVKSFGDFENILAADKPDIWESHRPAEGGEAGVMLKENRRKAAKIKSGREVVSAKTKQERKRSKATR